MAFLYTCLPILAPDRRTSCSPPSRETTGRRSNGSLRETVGSISPIFARSPTWGGVTPGRTRTFAHVREGRRRGYERGGGRGGGEKAEYVIARDILPFGWLQASAKNCFPSTRHLSNPQPNVRASNTSFCVSTVLRWT